jgi:hypothetical protein
VWDLQTVCWCPSCAVTPSILEELNPRRGGTTLSQRRHSPTGKTAGCKKTKQSLKQLVVKSNITRKILDYSERFHSEPRAADYWGHHHRKELFMSLPSRRKYRWWKMNQTPRYGTNYPSQSYTGELQIYTTHFAHFHRLLSTKSNILSSI